MHDLTGLGIVTDHKGLDKKEAQLRYIVLPATSKMHSSSHYISDCLDAIADDMYSYSGHSGLDMLVDDDFAASFVKGTDNLISKLQKKKDFVDALKERGYLIVAASALASATACAYFLHDSLPNMFEVMNKKVLITKEGMKILDSASVSFTKQDVSSFYSYAKSIANVGVYSIAAGIFGALLSYPLLSEFIISFGDVRDKLDNYKYIKKSMKGIGNS